MKPTVLQGTIGLMRSTKGVLSLLVLASVTALTFLGRVDGTSFAAVCSIVAGIFCGTRAIQDAITFRSGGSQ